MTTNPYAEAVEAIVRELGIGTLSPVLGAATAARENARRAVDAAVGPLLAPIRALHHEADEPGNDYHVCICGDVWPCPTTEALDAIESEATSEGGTRCVTVTRRYRDGEWEGDDLPTPDEALRMGWSV